MMKGKVWLFAAPILLLASFLHPVHATDEIPTLRIRSDGWTIKDLESVEVDPVTHKNNKDEWHNATIRLVLDGLTYMVELGAVHLHGSSSVNNTGYKKKNYALEFRDTSGDDKKVSIPFLDLPSESDFILHSSFWDPSYLRNVIAYELYRQLGRWAPRTHYVWLVINGESRGLYVLVEKIKRGPDRVDLPKLIETNPVFDACHARGGYIFKRDGDDLGWTWQSDYFPSIQWTLDYPDPGPGGATALEKSVIAKQVNSMDLSFRYGLWKFGGPAALDRLIDVRSWVDYTLLTELSMNEDGYYKSVFFNTQVTPIPATFKRPAGCHFTPVVMGPPWDFDLAFANSGRAKFERDTKGQFPACQITHLIYDDSEVRMPHVASLWSDDNFKQALKTRWQALRQTTLSWPNIDNLIDKFSKSTEKSREWDQVIWPSSLQRRDGGDAWPQPCDITRTSLAGEIEALKDFIQHRLDFMDQYLGGF